MRRTSAGLESEVSILQHGGRTQIACDPPEYRQLIACYFPEINLHCKQAAGFSFIRSDVVVVLSIFHCSYPSLGRRKSRWEGNIKMDLRELGWEDIDWFDLSQNSDRWRGLVNTVMNHRFP
jgi:hypothetical protein